MAGRARTTAAQVAGDSLFFPVNTEDPARSPPLSVALRRGGRGRGLGARWRHPLLGECFLAIARDLLRCLLAGDSILPKQKCWQKKPLELYAT